MTDRAMPQLVIRRATLERPARVYLIGETTQVFEGWREWVLPRAGLPAQQLLLPRPTHRSRRQTKMQKATEDDHRVLTCEETDLY